MPEVNHRKAFVSHCWFEYMVCRNFALMCTLCCMYVGSWHIEVAGYQTPLVRALSFMPHKRKFNKGRALSV